MSVSYIPEKVKTRLWGKSGGRCEYEGCNEALWLDSLTKVEFNLSYIAHIIADKPHGPRGHSTLSEELKADISNLMLMCDKHHRFIDKEQIEEHSVDRLLAMKLKHEARIEMLTEINENMQSHVLLYGANVGQHSSLVNWDKAKQAMIPRKYPAEKPAIAIGMSNSALRDDEDLFWRVEREQLHRQFTYQIKRRIDLGDIQHLSVFAMAPQPLLIELGIMISDIRDTDVYQIHREPANWEWREHPADFNYIIKEPIYTHKKVALALSLSGTIHDERITSVLGEDTSIWTLTINTPYNDYLQSGEQLRMLRRAYRGILDKIKYIHGHDNCLHLFPAAPVAAAIEFGRVWMPKADLPLRLYDENQGFHHAFDIGM